MKKYPFHKQEGKKDCGVTCLSMIIEYYGGKVPIERLRELSCTDQKGVDAYHLISCAEELGFHAKGLKGTLEDLKSINVPFIAHVLLEQKEGHYIVIYKMDFKRRQFLVADPADSLKKISFDYFEKIWDGIILTFYPYQKLPFYEKQFSLLKLLKQYYKEYRIEFFQLSFFSLLITIFSVFQSFFFQILVDEMALSTEKKLYFSYFFFFLSILFFKHLIDYFRHHLLLYVNERIDYFLHYDIFSALMNLPYRFYRSKTTGEITSKINDLELVKTFGSEFLTTIVVETFLGTTCLLCLCYLNFKISIVIICGLLFLLLLSFWFHKKVKQAVRKVQVTRSKSISHMVESIYGYESIKGLFQEQPVVQKYMSNYSKYLKQYRLLYKVSLKQNLIKEFLFDIFSIIILVFGICEILDGNMTIGELISYQMLSNYCFLPIRSFTSMMSHFEEVKSAFEHITELFYEEPKKEALHCSIQFPLDIQNLNFYFKDTPIIKNFTIQMKQGEKWMMAGNSGSGKSTLMKLLLKYYPVERNQIFFHQIDILDISEEEIKKHISYVSQNETLFSMSLWDNIRLDSKEPDEEILKICRICEVDQIIKNHPLGYFMPIEENGFGLSGGEKQRVILARALVQKKPFLILDEAMSEMDCNQERRILKNILIDSNLSLIFITHRLDNMDLFERFLQLENGSLRKDIIKNE